MSVLYSLIDTLLPFEWTEFAYMKNAFLAVLLITPLFGLVGTMVVNNKMSFFSDALGHSALTGIAIGVLLGVDNYLLSMLGFALLFALCISAVMSSGTSSADTIIGVFSSTGLALGVVLLSATGGFAKYSSYLIGDILTVQPSEIGLLAIVLAAVVISWGIAFFEYLLQVPANRVGYGYFSAAELKAIQEIISLSVFAFFSTLYLGESLRWNHFVGFGLIVLAAFFIFKKW